jgi:hypothetical protein
MGKRKALMRRNETNIPRSIQTLELLPENLEVEMTTKLEIVNGSYSANGEGFRIRDLGASGEVGTTTFDGTILMNSFGSRFMMNTGAGTYQEVRPMFSFNVMAGLDKFYRRMLVKRFTYKVIFRVQGTQTSYETPLEDIYVGIAMRSLNPPTIRTAATIAEREDTMQQMDSNWTRAARVPANNNGVFQGACFAGSVDLSKLAMSGGLQYNSDLEYSRLYDKETNTTTYPQKEIYFTPKVWQQGLVPSPDPINVMGTIEIIQNIMYYDRIEMFA